MPRVLAAVDEAAAIGECDIARDDAERAKTGQRGDEVGHYAVREIARVGVAGGMIEGQHDQARSFCHGRCCRAVRHEAIAQPGHGNDPVAAIGPAAEPLAQLRYLDAEIGLFHKEARPGSVHQAGLGDDLSLRLDQSGKQRQRAMAEPNRPIRVAKARAVHIERKAAKSPLPCHAARLAAKGAARKAGWVEAKHARWRRQTI